MYYTKIDWYLAMQQLSYVLPYTSNIALDCGGSVQVTCMSHESRLWEECASHMHITWLDCERSVQVTCMSHDSGLWECTGHMHVTWLTITNRVWLLKVPILSTSQQGYIRSVTAVTDGSHWLSYWSKRLVVVAILKWRGQWTCSHWKKRRNRTFWMQCSSLARQTFRSLLVAGEGVCNNKPAKNKGQTSKNL